MRPADAVIHAAAVGSEVGPVSQTVDARWLMAYAAGLGETDGRSYDTRAPGGPAAHPLFAVCYVLHGTATLALAVSRVIVRDLDGEPTRVRGIGARFTGMVLMPSALTARGRDRGDDHVRFDVVDAAGAVILSDGGLRAHPLPPRGASSR